MKSYFKGNGYDTPENTRRSIIDRLLLNTRGYFVVGYVNEIIKARSLAVKGVYDRNEWINSSFNVFKLIERCGGHIHLRGLDNIRSAKGPVVFISNHMSTLETFVFPCIIAPLLEVTFIVKRSLVNHPLFGPVMRSREPVVVNRENPREDFQKVMTEGKKILAKGASLIVFPQSTRTVEFNPEEFNSLGIKLAKAAGVPVMPVAIRTDFWGNGRFLKDVGPINRHNPVHIVFGKPFAVQGNGKEEHKQVVNYIINHLQQWGVPVRGLE